MLMSKNEIVYKTPCTFCKILQGVSPANWVGADSGAKCFHNRLKWTRVMLLSVPTVHMTQEELWTSNSLLPVAKMAVNMGRMECPEGFQIISNFGTKAHQTIDHAHIHSISEINQNPENSAPEVLKFVPAKAKTQLELWRSSELLDVIAKAVEQATEEFEAFRIMANYLPPYGAVDGGPAELYVFGGGTLTTYI